MRQSRKLSLLGAAVVVLTVGCGGGDPAGVDVPPSPESPTEVTTSPTAPPGPETEVMLTGRVEAGVEPGCLVLDVGETRYLLVGGDEDRLEPGRRVTVTGVADPGTPTTCMEGIPFRVTEVEPVE